jgi:hypothetical protein
MFHKSTLLICLAFIVAVRGAAFPRANKGTNVFMDPGVSQCADSEDEVNCKDGLIALATP